MSPKYIQRVVTDIEPWSFFQKQKKDKNIVTFFYFCEYLS